MCIPVYKYKLNTYLYKYIINVYKYVLKKRSVYVWGVQHGDLIYIVK